MRQLIIAFCGLVVFGAINAEAQTPADTSEGTGDAVQAVEPVQAAEVEVTGAADLITASERLFEGDADDDIPAEIGTGVVRVELVGVEGERRPLDGIRVSLEPTGVLRPTADQRLEGTTGPDGQVTFELPDVGRTYRATAFYGGFAFNATGAVRIGLDEPVRLAVYETTSDPAALRATRMIVMMSLHEEYLVVEHHFSLVMDAPNIYWAGDDPTDGLEIRLPAGVEGIRVLEPQREGHVVAGDTGILVRGPIGPPNSLRSDGPFVTVRYSLPNTSETFVFEQAMVFPVDDAIILVPQVTDFERFPSIDVDLRVPQCEQGARPEDTVCFGLADSDRPPLALLPGVDRREVWGGVGEAGATLRFETRGWPSYEDPFADAALYGSVLMLLVGVILVVRQFRRGSQSDGSSQTPKRRLEEAKIQLLEELLRVRAEFDEGYLPKSEYETTDLIIRNRLEAVYDALELQPEKDSSDPAGSDARS